MIMPTRQKWRRFLSGTVYNFILFPDSILDVASVIKILKSYEKYAFYSHAMFAFPLDVYNFKRMVIVSTNSSHNTCLHQRPGKFDYQSEIIGTNRA